MVKNRERIRGDSLRADRCDPTPQTLAMLTEDPLRVMIEKGFVDAAGERACEEIRAVYLAVCREVMSRGLRLGEEFGVPAGGGRTYQMPQRLAEAHARRYLPWTHAHARDVIDACMRLIVERETVVPAMVGPAAEAIAEYARRMRLDRCAA